jgi:hypothetical protein
MKEREKLVDAGAAVAETHGVVALTPLAFSPRVILS